MIAPPSQCKPARSIPPGALLACHDGHERVEWRSVDGHACWYCGRMILTPGRQ